MFTVFISKLSLWWQGAATGGVLYEIGFLKISQKFTGKHLYQGLRPQACNFIKNETLAKVFSCEFCVIHKNTFSTEHLRTTASAIRTNSGFRKNNFKWWSSKFCINNLRKGSSILPKCVSSCNLETIYKHRQVGNGQPSQLRFLKRILEVFINKWTWRTMVKKLT